MGWKSRVQMGKKLRKVGFGASLLLVSVASLGLFVYSFFQITDSETLQATNTSSFTIDCSAEPYDGNHPLRFKPYGFDGYVSCAWPWTNTVYRLFSSGVGMLYPFFVLFFGIIKKKKWVVWVGGLGCFAVMAMFIAVTVVDSKSINTSKGWCESFDQAESCSYLPFAGMALVDSVLLFIWCAEGLTLLVYAKKFIKDDFTDWTFDYTEEYDTDADYSASHAAARATI